MILEPAHLALLDSVNATLPYHLYRQIMQHESLGRRAGIRRWAGGTEWVLAVTGGKGIAARARSLLPVRCIGRCAPDLRSRCAARLPTKLRVVGHKLRAPVPDRQVDLDERGSQAAAAAP